MTYNIDLTQEEINQLIAYIREDKKDVLRTNIPSKLISLFMSFQDKMAKELRDSENRAFMLERKLDRFKEKEQEDIAQGNFAETDRDSYEVALCLLYCLQQVKTYKLTKSKLLYILYLAYASWLAGHKERLFAEHPVATEFGPQFWRVYKRLNINTNVPYDVWKNMCEKNPGIARFLDNVAHKYYDYSEKMLREPIMKSEPYRHALPEKNHGKWNKEITDSEIFVWRNETK